MLEILIVPFVACVILTGIHCYLGIHVVMRGVIFVDLALAQIAALGAATGTMLGFEAHSLETYLCALSFTVVGAALFTIGRFKDRRVPQEAIIGIVYAVSTAATILILSKIAVERDEIESMLVGRLLFADWHEITHTLSIYVPIALVHVLLRKQFFKISSSTDDTPGRRLWDFVFYVTLGIVVTCSVQIAGVLLVFSFLVVPATCAMMFFTSVSHRLFVGWGFGLIASICGLAASAHWDLPTGASIVATFGGLLVCCAIAYGIRGRRVEKG